MKVMFLLCLCTLVAGIALAQSDNDNSLGMFFTDDIAAILEADDPDNPPNEPPHPYSNVELGGAPSYGYIVLLYPTVESVAGYEVGITFVPDDSALFILAVNGPNGWTNFGDNTNHLAGYGVPLPCDAGGVVLAELQFLYSGGPVEIQFGPATPPSIPGGPVIASGENPDDLYVCNLTCSPAYCPTVATINGEGVVATDYKSFTSVKALFE